MRKLSGLILVTVFSLANALEAPVEELGSRAPEMNGSSSRGPASAGAASPQNQAVVDLYFEVQALQEEVRELRGIVEEQANEIRQLRQRQMDDYQDLDSRISGATGSGLVPQASPGQGPAVSTTPTQPSISRDIPAVAEPGDTAGGMEGDYEAYTATYNLLKARKIDEAAAGFTVFVAKFPNSPYTPNAYYWLGEIYLLQNNLNEAAKAFSMVTNKFPAHRKALDAKFKLAKVYHLMGENEKSRALLNEVAATNSSAAALAKAYLNENF